MQKPSLPAGNAPHCKRLLFLNPHFLRHCGLSAAVGLLALPLAAVEKSSRDSKQNSSVAADKPTGWPVLAMFAPVKTHALLGPLRVTHAAAPPHSRPTETFVYEVDVSDGAHLRALMEDAAHARQNQPPPNRFVSVTDGALAGREVARLLEQHSRVHVVSPGLRHQDGVLQLLRGDGHDAILAPSI